MPLPLVPMLGGALAGFSITAIKYLLPFIIISAIKFLGITLITFTALDLVTDQITTYVTGSFDNLGTNALAILKMAGFIDAINVYVAGWVAQLQLAQIMGTFTKLKITPST